MRSTTQPATPPELQSILDSLPAGRSPRSAVAERSDQVQAKLKVLAKFECWEPAVRLLEQQIAASPGTLEFAIALVDTFLNGLGDSNRAESLMVGLIRSERLTYPRWHDDVLSQVVPMGDFSRDAQFCERVWAEFGDLKDRVLCLEHLCWLLEKKVLNEGKLHTFYERLLKTDPANTKALRFFKMVHTQGQDWDGVARILERLVALDQRKIYRYRDAHELAVVLLYHLDNPEGAIEVLDEHCVDSPLDLSAVYYDAFQRLGDRERALKLFREMLVRTQNNTERGVLHYRIGLLEQESGRWQQAVSAFERSVSEHGGLLAAHEGLITSLVELKLWHRAEPALMELRSVVQSESSQHRIDELLERIRRVAKEPLAGSGFGT